MAKRKFTWKVELTLKVPSEYVEDGFNFSEKEWMENLENKIEDMFPLAYPDEVSIKTKVILAPDKALIKKLQAG